MRFDLIFKETLQGSASTIWTIASIVFPLMIVLEILRAYQVLDRLSLFLKPLTDRYQMSHSASFPLLVGLIFGLAYGAGVIVQSAKEGELSQRDLILLIVFLASCHAVFEDTLLFVTIGANGFLVLGIRVVTAFLVTWLISKRMPGFLQKSIEDAARSKPAAHDHPHLLD